MTQRSFRTFEAVASIWFNGSCGAIHDPDHSEATMAEDTAEGLKDALPFETAASGRRRRWRTSHFDPLLTFTAAPPSTMEA